MCVCVFGYVSGTDEPIGAKRDMFIPWNQEDISERQKSLFWVPVRVFPLARRPKAVEERAKTRVVCLFVLALGRSFFCDIQRCVEWPGVW